MRKQWPTHLSGSSARPNSQPTRDTGILEHREHSRHSTQLFAKTDHPNHVHQYTYEGNRFGVTIETTPKAVIINHDDTLANNALFSKNANSITNRDKDYISTVLQTQKHMLSVVPLRPDQLDELFDPDGTLRSVRTVSKVFEGRKTAKDSLFRK
jgi:hypothetical protein